MVVMLKGWPAVMLAGALIRSGEARVIMAGGMENMTRGPHLLPQARVVDIGCGQGLMASLSIEGTKISRIKR